MDVIKRIKINLMNLAINYEYPLKSTVFDIRSHRRAEKNEQNLQSKYSAHKNGMPFE